MRALLTRGLAATAALWPDIRVAYAWVHRAAHLLANDTGQPTEQVRRTYDELLAEMARDQAQAGALAPAVAHFLKVTDSYWPGLFHCYEVPGLPRTNNDLEQYFGAARYHQRRASGRKSAAPATVVRGAVRVVASVAARLRDFRATDLRPATPDEWRALRRTLAYRHETRRAQLRFRRDPSAYLARLEAQLLKPSLPP